MILVLAGFLALSACTSLEPLEEAEATPYRLGPGDLVRVTVYGVEALNNDFRISDSGMLSLPLLDPLPAKGATLEELESALEAAIAEHGIVRNPSVAAQIQEYRPFYILGEVQRPGQYQYAPGMTVLSAVSIAGGYTYRAETSHVAITRDTGNGIVKRSARPDSPVLPDDRIQVFEGWF